MSIVIRADILGYCMGVRRAVEIAKKALKDFPDRDVYTLGPLIHNKTALNDLAALGLKMLDESQLDKIQFKSTKLKEASVVIIRAHGTPPLIRKKLQKAGLVIIDATCPRVLLNQKRAADYTARGYSLIIAGDKTHGEVIAVAGSAAAKSSCFIVQNLDEAKSLAASPDFFRSKAVLISQTTISEQEYEDVKNVLTAVRPDISLFDTICPATKERQSALKVLGTKTDYILVVGGKNSANTQRLYQSARLLCPHSAHIENVQEIPKKFFAAKTVGITAGASTPDTVIDDVEISLVQSSVNRNKCE